MALSERAEIYYNVWCCAYQRRYNAKVKGDWDLYDREHETILMCLNRKDAKWTKFESDDTHPTILKRGSKS
jgi:hypothetical protein